MVFGGGVLPSYLALLQVGFTMPIIITALSKE